jgi:hypothetical protein
MLKPTAALAGLAAALVLAAPATADPTVEQPPEQPIEEAGQGPLTTLSAIGTILGQRGSAPSGPLGLPDMSGNAVTMLLGQNAVPTAAGDVDPAAGPSVTGPSVTVPSVTVPKLSALNADYLLPQNITPAVPGQGTAAPGLGPDQDSPGTGRISFLRRLHEMYAAGELKGAFLGQLPKDELGQPVLPVADGSATILPVAGPTAN